MHDKRVPLFVLLGGLTGLCTGLGLQVWVSAIAYPLNIGGRPYLSWPMFVPVTFELTILFAAFAAVFGMFGLNGLPMPYHPVFNVERFTAHASQDDSSWPSRRAMPKFDRERTRAFLQGLGAKEINDVEASHGSRFAARGCWRLLFCVLCALLGACRQDMHNQPKYRGLRASAFFADGSSARPLVEGTVARGTLQDDEAFFTGKVDKVTVKELPFPVDEAVLNRGQERFNIYCSPCHDRTGSGNGMVVQRGYQRSRRRFTSIGCGRRDVGYFFDVITNGFGAMPDYKAQIAPRDRWAIVAYIRALQLSQHAAAARRARRRSRPRFRNPPAAASARPEKH